MHASQPGLEVQHGPAVVIGVVKMRSSTKWPSGVTRGWSPPIGPASPKLGLLQTWHRKKTARNRPPLNFAVTIANPGLLREYWRQVRVINSHNYVIHVVLFRGLKLTYQCQPFQKCIIEITWERLLMITHQLLHGVLDVPLHPLKISHQFPLPHQSSFPAQSIL